MLPAISRWCLWACLAGVLISSCTYAPVPGARPRDRATTRWFGPADDRPAMGPRGMVATDAELATRVGVETLQRGGNAIDAAVATAFALAVVLPEAGNIGGGGFMVVHLADGRNATLDFREKAPLAATRSMYLDAQQRMTDLSVYGHLAAAVPGSVAGLWEAHRRFGRLPWNAVVEPSIRLAADGFVADSFFVLKIQDDSLLLARYAASAALFLPGGTPPPRGSLWKNGDLARTLQRIADRGPEGFYAGETADLIVAEMKRGGGCITHEDLRRYTAVWRTPIEAMYRGHRVISMGPPSSGGITLAMTLNMLQEFDLPSIAWHSADQIHLVTEALRRAYADRNAYLGDPDFVSIPVEALLSDAYAAQRRSAILPDRATSSHSLREGVPDAPREGMHTTHLSVADSAGNVVALTTTINFLFGCGVTVTGAGFLLNNEMDDFASKPGSPNSFGLVQGEANAIAPAKRSLSSMTPTIVLDPAGTPVLITGARGGPRIISSVLQILLNVIDYRMNVVDAVSAPRFHHQHLPDTLLLERGGFTHHTMQTLRVRGHALEETTALAIAPSITRMDGIWYGRHDPRRAGSAQGY